MSEPWNRESKDQKDKIDPHMKVIVMTALIWSGAMLAIGECIKGAKSRVKRVAARYNRNVGQED